MFIKIKIERQIEGIAVICCASLWDTSSADLMIFLPSKLAKTPRTNPEFTVQIERANASVVSPRPGDSRIIQGSFDHFQIQPWSIAAAFQGSWFLIGSQFGCAGWADIDH